MINCKGRSVHINSKDTVYSPKSVGVVHLVVLFLHGSAAMTLFRDDFSGVPQ